MGLDDYSNNHRTKMAPNLTDNWEFRPLNKQMLMIISRLGVPNHSWPKPDCRHDRLHLHPLKRIFSLHTAHRPIPIFPVHPRFPMQPYVSGLIQRHPAFPYTNKHPLELGAACDNPTSWVPHIAFNDQILQRPRKHHPIMILHLASEHRHRQVSYPQRNVRGLRRHPQMRQRRREPLDTVHYLQWVYDSMKPRENKTP